MEILKLKKSAHVSKRAKKDSSAHILKVRSRGEKVLYAIVFVFFAAYALSLIYPFVWLAISSLKPYTDYTLDMAQGRPFALPNTLEWLNYSYALRQMTYNDTNFFGMFFNSLWYSIACVGCGLISSSALAYVLVRFKFRGCNLIYAVAIFTMTVPVVGNTGSMFKLTSDIGIYNTPLFAIIVSFGATGLSFLILYGFFKGLPHSYAEAVYIDGGGEMTVYLRVMLPLSIPCFASLGIVGFINAWNDYTNVLLYMPSYPTIASGMYAVKTSMIRTGKDSIYFAGIILSIIPILVLFCCFSDVIMKNMSVGGLKG